MKDLALNPLAADHTASVAVGGVPAPVDILPALTEALGEAFARTAGTHATRLTAPATPGATSITVESTLEWETSGEFTIGGRRVRYTGRTSTTLTGLSWDVGSSVVFPIGSVVEDGTRRFSSLDQVRADMLPGMARGTYLDTVARSHGEARPWAMSDETFRGLLQVLLSVPRGTWLATWQVLEAALADYHIRRTNGSTSSVTPARISTATNGTFKKWHLHRFIRIGTKVYRIVGTDTVNGAWADLSSQGGPWWSAAQFGTASGITFSLLAFRIEVSPASIGPYVVYVQSYLPASFATAPPTYLQPAGAAETPVGETRGGELLADSNVSGVGHQPFYIGGGASSAVEALLADIVPHGVELQARNLLP